MIKKEYVDHISSLKQALNHGLKINKVHRAISCIQSDSLKEYIEMVFSKSISKRNEKNINKDE